MKITKRQLRAIIKEFYKSQKTSVGGLGRAPELEAILSAAEAAHTSDNVSYAELKDFFWRLNSVYANQKKIMEAKRQLRRIIRETVAADPKGALAAVQEMGYSLKIPPYVDSNNIAINDALEGYPGEFTYEDIIAAVKAAGGVM